MNSMYLALGYRCNYRCYFCPCGKKEEKIDAAQRDEMIDAIEKGIHEQHITHITLSGGEPTLHPAFHDVLKYCADNKLMVSILSNGDTFCHEDNVARFFDGIPRQYIHVTTALHAESAGLHDRVTCVAGSFERTVQGLHNIMRAGIRLSVKQVISCWNYERLSAFVDFCYREFGPRVSMTLCGMDFCGMTREQIEQVAVGYKEIGPHLEEALDLVTNLREQFGAFPEFTVADLPLCCVDPYYWGYFAKVSRSGLSQYSAPANASGKVESAQEVVNDCDIFFKACGKCCVADDCPGVWFSAYHYLGETQATCMKPEQE